jgi:Holliday junction resolvasome RuvABC endonuclease subunit
MDIVALGLDPGYRNFGWAVLRVRVTSTSLSIRVEDFGTLTHTLLDLVDNPVDQLMVFLTGIEAIVQRHSVQSMSIERFQSRGLRGRSSELTNIMIGSLLTRYSTHPWSVITPATWKNAVKRGGVNLKQLYSDLKRAMSPHELDACLIALYGVMSRTPYAPLSNLSAFKSVMLTSSPIVKRLGSPLISH